MLALIRTGDDVAINPAPREADANPRSHLSRFVEEGRYGVVKRMIKMRNRRVDPHRCHTTHVNRRLRRLRRP
jgi:hypothetical protein